LRLHTARERAVQARLADAITSFSGSMLFVYLHIGWFGVWLLVNTGRIGIPPFDPFPYGLLTMIVSLEAIFLSTFVLISQNRFSDESDRRAELDLQIGLLAEHELTRVLQMLDAIQDKLGIENDASSVQGHSLCIDGTATALYRAYGTPWPRHRLTAAALAQDALHSMRLTLPVFPPRAHHHFNGSLSMHLMPLLGVGTAVAMAPGSAWAPAAYRADRYQRLWPWAAAARSSMMQRRCTYVPTTQSIRNKEDMDVAATQDADATC
jgi:uncharacterized membrane protein